MLNSDTTKRIKLFTLVMLVVGSIDSVRNLPATALFGSSLIFFTIFSAIVFLIPTALVSAELASGHSVKGGIYHWVREAFGERCAFLAIWLQWINTMVWYPTILSFIAATAAFLINPALAQNKLYLVTVIIGTFFALTVMSLKGIQVSAKFASICTVLGTLIPMGFIILLAIIWLAQGQPLQVHFGAKDLLPSLHHSDNWVSLTAIMTAFLGMELAGVHVNHIENPQRNYPKAMLFSVVIILVTMSLGALAIAIVLPAAQINLVDGVMEAFANFFKVYHLHWLMPVMVFALVIGNLGGMVNWVISPAKGLLQAAEYGFLPKYLRTERHVMIAQAILVAVLCGAFLLLPSVNGFYWLLTDLSTQLYMLMYALMFLAAIYLRYKFSSQQHPFMVPGGKLGMWLVAGLGLIGCAITLIVGFFPPTDVDVGSAQHYEMLFGAGMLAMILPVLAFYYYHYLSRSD
jgi:amino acid transporter